MQSGIIEVVDLSIEEQEIFLRYAHQLGDGEAASGAIAIGRSGAVATDDRKARAVLAQHNPAIDLVGTVALLQGWEVSTGLSKKEVGEAIRAIRARARYEPGTSDYGAEWWRERVAAAESADQ